MNFEGLIVSPSYDPLTAWFSTVCARQASSLGVPHLFGAEASRMALLPQIDTARCLIFAGHGLEDRFLSDEAGGTLLWSSDLAGKTEGLLAYCCSAGRHLVPRVANARSDGAGIGFSEEFVVLVSVIDSDRGRSFAMPLQTAIAATVAHGRIARLVSDAIVDAIEEEIRYWETEGRKRDKLWFFIVGLLQDQLDHMVFIGGN